MKCDVCHRLYCRTLLGDDPRDFEQRARCWKIGYERLQDDLAAAEERGRRAGVEERDRLITALREVERMTSVGPPSRPGGITAGSGWYSTLLSVNAYVHGALAPRDSGKEASDE